MSYQSFGFIIFSAVVVLLYYLLGKKRQLWVLTGANIVFFLFSGAKYIPFILVTILATYIAGRLMGNIYDKADKALAECADMPSKKAVRAKAKSEAKRVLIGSFVVAVGLLAVCKYTGFMIKNINGVLSLVNIPQIKMFNMILPIGISFYTFMAISYVLDIYWKRYKAEKNLLLYATYLAYFPHVVQGPIDRFNEFREQVKDGVGFNPQNLVYGAELVIWGLFKKLVIADRLGMMVDTVVDNWQNYDGFVLALTFAVYSIQIYTDFSGCIDIVTGVSEMFGIKLRKNFNHPYFAKDMGEFWRRWHMSLMEWFKDYLYFPVSTSSFVKKTKKSLKAKYGATVTENFATCFPMLVVWLVTGIWHGSSWRFVAWGLFHAAVLIISHLCEPYTKKFTAAVKVDTDSFGWHFWQMARTFLICCIGRVFFRAASMKTALSIFARIFTEFNPGSLFAEGLDLGMDSSNLVLAAFAVIILWIVDMMQERMQIRESLAKQNTPFRWAVIMAGIFAVLIFGIYGPGYDAASFIYEQF